MRVPLPDLGALAELDTQTVALPDDKQAFVVRHRGALYAYENRCPHWGVDLDLGLGDFVDRRVGRIFCRNHAAEFQVDTGLCVSGPCRGKFLTAITITPEGDALLLSEPDA